MLHQEMSTTDFSFQVLLGNGVRGHVGSVILAHVVLQRLTISTCWWLPSRFFVASIKVVRQIFAVGMANFPACWQSGSLRYCTLIICYAWSAFNACMRGDCAHHSWRSRFVSSIPPLKENVSRLVDTYQVASKVVMSLVKGGGPPLFAYGSGKRDVPIATGRSLMEANFTFLLHPPTYNFTIIQFHDHDRIIRQGYISLLQRMFKHALPAGRP